MEVETAAKYFDYLAGLLYTHLHRVFCWFEIRFAPTKLREKSKKGASALFLVVLRGFQRGKSPFGVFFLPPAAFSLPRKEKGAESSLAHSVHEKGVDSTRKGACRIRSAPDGADGCAKSSAPTRLAGEKIALRACGAACTLRGQKVSPFRGDGICALRAQNRRHPPLG